MQARPRSFARGPASGGWSMQMLPQPKQIPMKHPTNREPFAYALRSERRDDRRESTPVARTSRS
ncbi:hypothetical protein K0M31_000844, partial [Melipona bicolor]